MACFHFSAFTQSQDQNTKQTNFSCSDLVVYKSYLKYRELCNTCSYQLKVSKKEENPAGLLKLKSAIEN